MRYDRTASVLALVSVLTLLPCGRAQAQRRMEPIPADKMTDAQKKAAAEYQAVRKSELTSGIFMDLLRVPDAMLAAFKMRTHLQNNSVLGNKLTELGILLTLREWTQQQEWAGHSQSSVRAGVSAEIVAAIAEGRRPAKMAEDEEILYDFCTELQRNHSVSDLTYGRMVGKFGEAGVIEAIQIGALYTWVSMTENTVRQPVPPNAKPLAPFPQTTSSK